MIPSGKYQKGIWDGKGIPLLYHLVSYLKKFLVICQQIQFPGAMLENFTDTMTIFHKISIVHNYLPNANTGLNCKPLIEYQNSYLRPHNQLLRDDQQKKYPCKSDADAVYCHNTRE
jgi:hypothetical protein